MTNAMTYTTAAAAALVAIGAQAQGTLLPGETIEQGAGFPAIAWFQAGDADKPLLVFVPGAHHTSRVFYGGHDGSVPEDFVATHAAELGYPVLALSYPIATATPAITTDHPEFMMRDWGRQTTAIAERFVEANDLSGDVVVVAWSMGGNIVQAVHEAMGESDLDLEGYVSLSATPPIPGLIWHEPLQYPMLEESGYTDRRNRFDGWYGQVADNGAAQDRPIVSEEVFKTVYQGDIPINLQGYGQQYRDGAFVTDFLATQADGKPFDFQAFPLVGAVVPNGRGDGRHAMVDQASWAIYNANTIYKRYIGGSDIDVNALSDEAWTGLLDLTRGIDDRLSTYVDGNHFFFMGKAGASATAEAIDTLVAEFAAVKSDVGGFLGTEID